MAVFVDNWNEEMTSAFIDATCQFLIPKSPLCYSDNLHNLFSTSIPIPTEYLVVCGSHAEFYIVPLNTCIDDVGMLYAQTNELVFSGDSPVLPSDMSGLSETIECYKIEPYERYPGFVRLRYWGEMDYDWKYKKYEFNHAADTYCCYVPDFEGFAYRYSRLSDDTGFLLKSISGPAVQQRTDKEFIGSYPGCDIVMSFWCPHWPKEAQGWLKRPRLNGWPTTDIISEVAQNGCHLVYVQHRSCRNDKEQWRFSFSLAEVILLQSWTQIQQIVYHLLRFFVKRKLIQNDCPKEDEILCPYHLKTLMLWTCEEMSPEWWESSSVISICSQLLKLLADWLKKRYCPNYFIPEANLFHTPSNPKVLAESERQLNKFCNSGILCNWFVENYILSFIRSNFKHVETRPHFMYYMQALLEYWKVSELESLDSYLHTTFRFSHYNSRSIMKHMSDPGLCQYLNTGFSFK